MKRVGGRQYAVGRKNISVFVLWIAAYCLLPTAYCHAEDFKDAIIEPLKVSGTSRPVWDPDRTGEGKPAQADPFFTKLSAEKREFIASSLERRKKFRKKLDGKDLSPAEIRNKTKKFNGKEMKKRKKFYAKEKSKQRKHAEKMRS